MWATRMKWSGQSGFKDAEVEQKPYGLHKKYKNFEFQKVAGAGHYVPMDLPDASVTMLWDFLGLGPGQTVSEHLEGLRAVN